MVSLPAYATAAIIFGSSILVAVIATQYLQRFLRRWIHASQEQLVKRTSRPFVYLVVFLGLYYATEQFALSETAMTIIDRVSFVAIALLLAYLLTEAAKIAIRRHVQGNVIGDHAPEFLGNVVGIIIFTPTILIILSRFNIEITPILATLGVGSLAVGLALQGTLGNFFAGLRLISEKPIKVGDYVEILQHGVEGYIDDIGWSTTRVRTLHDNVIVVPNSSFVDSNLFNSSLPSAESTVLVETGVSYDEDLDHVETVCKEVIGFVQDQEANAVSDHDPWVRFKGFDESNITVRLGIRVKAYDKRHPVVHELIKALKQRFDEEGIEISWPIRKIYEMNDESSV